MLKDCMITYHVMLYLIISTTVRANDLCSQSKASRKELKLHGLQQGRKLSRDVEPTALFLHLGQER